MHKPIQFYNLSFSCPHKTCFSDFSGQISYGNRIAIIGNNGSGKSSLIRVFAGITEPSEGEINLPNDLKISFIQQIIEENQELSGGERFNKELTKALAQFPDLLILDEPTNHLDSHNRQALKRMLNTYMGTLIIVTHDPFLLENTVSTIWHLDRGKIHIFIGSYNDYQRERQIKLHSSEQELKALLKQKKELHLSLMKEERRAKNSRAAGNKHISQKKWPTIVSGTKVNNANLTAGRKKAALSNKKEMLLDDLALYKEPEKIDIKFNLEGFKTNQTLISISEGRLAYKNNITVLDNLSLHLKGGERIAICGRNGSGKSTLIKGILNDEAIIKEGRWLSPKASEVGYLSQHYESLDPDKTVFETISSLLPNSSYQELRKFLNEFLFRKNEEIEIRTKNLSGGEKARLCLLQIALLKPKLLILDEMTNNLDLETRSHVIEVLLAYPGALIAISHDEDFLRAININDFYAIHEQQLEICYV